MLSRVNFMFKIMQPILGEIVIFENYQNLFLHYNPFQFKTNAICKNSILQINIP